MIVLLVAIMPFSFVQWEEEEEFVIPVLKELIVPLPNRSSAYTINIANAWVWNFLSLDDYADIVSDKLLIGEPHTPRDLIVNFCSKVLYEKSLFAIGSENAQQYFDPKQSLFVLMMCANVEPTWAGNSPYLFNNKWSYFQYYHFLSFGFDMEYCNPAKSLAYCDFENVWLRIFDRIINDYVNIKQADVYGLKTKKYGDSKKSSKSAQANEFLKKYFYDTMFCDPDGEKDSECHYPKTEREMKKYLRKAEKLFRDVKLVDYEKLFEDSLKYPQECNPEAVVMWTYNIMMCGLYGDDNPMRAFVNLLYNELFYYNLFMVTYEAYLQDIQNGTAITFKWLRKEQAEKIDMVRQHTKWSADAIKLSIRMLNEMFTTFPLHIGFLLYNEEIVNMRAELVKIVTPIYTLFDKLQNAQEKS